MYDDCIDTVGKVGDSASGSVAVPIVISPVVNNLKLPYDTLGTTAPPTISIASVGDVVMV